MAKNEKHDYLFYYLLGPLKLDEIGQQEKIKKDTMFCFSEISYYENPKEGTETEYSWHWSADFPLFKALVLNRDLNRAFYTLDYDGNMIGESEPSDMYFVDFVAGRPELWKEHTKQMDADLHKAYDCSDFQELEEDAATLVKELRELGIRCHFRLFPDLKSAESFMRERNIALDAQDLISLLQKDRGEGKFSEKDFQQA